MYLSAYSLLALCESGKTKKARNFSVSMDQVTGILSVFKETVYGEVVVLCGHLLWTLCITKSDK